MDTNSIDILLVEDSMNDAELTIRELKKHNMSNNLFHVTDGEQALDFIFATGQFFGKRNVLQRPKLILLDIQMPILNGIEVLKKIREDKLTRLTPVVILSSSKENTDIRKCYELGVNSYIVKSVGFEGFAESIRTLGFYWLLLNQLPSN